MRIFVGFEWVCILVRPVGLLGISHWLAQLAPSPSLELLQKFSHLLSPSVGELAASLMAELPRLKDFSQKRKVAPSASPEFGADLCFDGWVSHGGWVSCSLVATAVSF